MLKHTPRNIMHTVHFEYRPVRYMFGTYNYGEVSGLRNRADGDLWDVFAPGYDHKLKLQHPYLVKDIIGLFHLNNGNHKIAVRLFVPGYDEVRAQREIQTYCRRYSRSTGKKGQWISIDDWHAITSAQQRG